MFHLYTKGKNMSEKFTVKDREELERLIRAMIDRDGPNCDLNFIDVSKVTDMHCLFLSSNFNGDISKWNVSNVTDMHAMFMSSSFNGEIGEWDMSNVSDMSEMFCKTIFNGDVNKWNISKGTDVTNAFTGSALDRNNNLPAWYKERITPKDKDSLKALINIALKHYNDCDLNFIDVSKITDMSELFKNSRYTAGVSRSGIERWNISNVTNMVGMFAESDFAGDLRQWESKFAANVNRTGIFYNAKNFTKEHAKTFAPWCSDGNGSEWVDPDTPDYIETNDLVL